MNQQRNLNRILSIAFVLIGSFAFIYFTSEFSSLVDFMNEKINEESKHNTDEKNKFISSLIGEWELVKVSSMNLTVNDYSEFEEEITLSIQFELIGKILKIVEKKRSKTVVTLVNIDDL